MTNSLKNHPDIVQERFALKVTSHLSVDAARLPHDISERLRAARVQAVSNRKIARIQTVASLVHSDGSTALIWGEDDRINWWSRVGSVLPLIALVVGLLAIHAIQSDNRAQEIAEIDAALLIDELPPAAFADPGFIQFLKSTD